MPKVSQEYKEGKKQQIIDALLRVVKSKSLMALSMQDIISEIGYSQGNIYRYFTDIDEIIAATLSQMRTKATIIPAINEIFEQSNDFTVTLRSITDLLAEFMEDGMDTYCKLDFEFNLLSMNFPERATKIMTHVNEDSQSNLGFLITKSFEKLEAEEQSGHLKMSISPAAFGAFVSASYEGIQMTALQSYKGHPSLPWENYRPKVQMKTLQLAMEKMVIQKQN